MSMRSGTALYLPVEAVTRFLDAYRAGRVEGAVTLQTLRDIGTPDSVAPRTLRALENLGLVAADGTHTDALRAFGEAAEPQHREVFGRIVRDAYPDVFQAIDDVALATADDLDAAFSMYDPPSQRHRMVRLFLGLCQYAGLVKGKVRRGGATRSSTPSTGARSRTAPREQHTVELDSGGAVTLTVAVRLFELSHDDRAFVLDLIDKVRSYRAEP